MQIGIMIEGQDGLNWDRWKRLLSAVEDLGFQCLFRSDHFTNPSGADKDSLELFVSLTYAASHTSRIEFGPMVAPVTFRHPAMTVRMASQIDDLSGGRLVLGLGAGWQEREHTKFGIPFYDFPTRYAMFEDALEVTMRLLLSDGPVNYDGEYFQLDDALLLPRPTRPAGPPVLIGGNGPKKTLPLVAKYADEWNAVFLDVNTLKERNALLDELLKENGRDKGDVRRSMMTGTAFARNDAEFQSALKDRKEEDLQARGIIYGTPSMFVDQLGKVAELGLDRIMLQWGDQDDIDGLEILARDVLPHFHS